MGTICNNLLCSSCVNVWCENIGHACQVGDNNVVTECASYMPPPIHVESDNCGNYLVMQSSANTKTYTNNRIKGGQMSRAEHYFENLIHTGSDECTGNANRDSIPDEIRETIEMCYDYVVMNIFGGKEELEEYLK